MLDETASINLLKSALAPLDYTFESFLLDGKPYTRLCAPNGNVWVMYDHNINYPSMPAAAARISRNKFVAHDFADRLGIRSPWTQQVVGPLDAQQRLAMLKRAPLVVKPADASLSNGVSLNITTDAQLQSALDYAQTYSDIVLVQEQVPGDEVRIVVIEGQARAAILRQTPRVVGDGQSTISQLIDTENQARTLITSPYLTYPLINSDLLDLSGIAFERVPAEDEIVQLGRGTMIKQGASIYNVLEAIDQSYLGFAEKMAGWLGAGFIAVDMIIQDYHQPATPNNYAFLEFNTSPVLKLFYGCRDGKHFDVLQYLAPLIDNALGGQASQSIVLGGFEKISLPEIGLHDVIAKVDTGAYSGAIHCTDLRIVQRGAAGKRVLKFVPADAPELATETEHFIKTYVRSANGHQSVRYLIDTTIMVRGQTYPIRIGLSDRSDMRRPVLVGRRFLRANDMLVDVKVKSHYDDKGETKL